MPTEAEIIATLTPQEVADRKAYNDAFMASVEKHNRSESRFKYLVSMAIMDAGIKNICWEKRIAKAHGGLWKKSWSLFTDLHSEDKRWVIECKIKSDLSSCAKALGQAIIYRHIAGFKHAIICFPSIEFSYREFGPQFEIICKENRIILAHETNIVEILKNL